MLDKILIIDFEDSFTYNIANVIFPFEKSCKVISHTEFFNTTIQECLITTERHGIILGPGPGHPDHYEKYFNEIKKLMHKKNIYILGICLGHQILGRISGYPVLKSHDQKHGQTVLVNFKGHEYEVQRYNSLSVFINNVETDFCAFDRGISYQFHPESVGTQQNDIFFKDLFAFLTPE